MIKKTKYCLQTIVLLVLILVGLALIFNKPICNFLIGLQSNRYQVSKVSKKEIKKNESADVTYDFSAVEPVSVQSEIGRASCRERV